MHWDKLGDATVRQIQHYTDSPKGGGGGAAITGQMGAASSVVHDMFTAAVFERL